MPSIRLCVVLISVLLFCHVGASVRVCYLLPAPPPRREKGLFAWWDAAVDQLFERDRAETLHFFLLLLFYIQRF